jgi:hypothetical protein
VPLIVAAVQSSSSPTSLASDSAQRTTPVSTLAVPATVPSIGAQLPLQSPGGAGGVNLKGIPLPSGGALLPPVPTPSLPVIPTLPLVQATLPPLPVATPSLPPIVP